MLLQDLVHFEHVDYTGVDRSFCSAIGHFSFLSLLELTVEAVKRVDFVDARDVRFRLGVTVSSLKEITL